MFCHPSQALASIKADRSKANDGLSSALLVVFLDSARNLPVSETGAPAHKDQIRSRYCDHSLIFIQIFKSAMQRIKRLLCYYH